MNNKITTLEIEEAIARKIGWRQHIIIPNISWGFNCHECDLIVVNSSGYAYEIEIKISKTDLIKDSLKWHKHKDFKNRLKYLYFAIPESLLPFINYIPEHAGIIVCRREIHGKVFARYERNPVLIKKCRPLTEQELLKLTRLGVMRIWSLKQRLIENYNNKINRLQL